ncbi:MAG TPA: sigma-54-dependent Fis family transcriptional regulator [candidate division Zixibacteria bacterium]|nr:sigma-54-dependent Fis family transcriptional regulator [candidate division Zixibacteria bacterium]
MSNPQPHILVVDDEESICQLLEVMLTEEGYWVRTATSYDEAMKLFETDQFDVVIADIMMPDVDGLTLLKDVKKVDPEIPVILITAYASLGSAVEALRYGAFDYITKPFKMDQIRYAVKRALETRALRRENRILKRELRRESDLSKFIGVSDAVREIKQLVRKIAPTDSTVLITGESGTGKELIARAIHQLSPRADGPFITINCAAIPETLLESELFGYVKGAFTGATTNKEGLFRAAHGGTFFMDEVGEISPDIQAKLLRMLETHQIIPLGATKPVEVDVRLIAATNKDLARMVDEGKFRRDLFYRLNVIHIHIPPLRERPEDIIPIAEHYVQVIADRMNCPAPKLSREAMQLLQGARWEGNVRELENVLERAMIMCDGDVILPEHLPDYIRNAPQTAAVPERVAGGQVLGRVLPLDEIEKAYILWAILQCGGNKSEAAKKLGIDLSTLYRKIERYGLKKYLK